MKRCLALANTLGVLGLLGQLAAAAPADVADSSNEEGDGEAESVLPTRLEDVIAVAVQQSPMLARARADRAIAIGSAGATRSEQAWVVTAKGLAARSAVADRVEVDPFAQVAQDKFSGSLSIARKLPNGASLSLEGSVEHTNTEYNITAINKFLTGQAKDAMTPTPPTTDTQQPDHQAGNTVTAKATFTQPLWKGMGSDVALAQEKKANIAVLDATIKGQQAAEEMIADLVSSYWELAYSNYEVDIRQESLALAKKQAEFSHEEKRVGAISDVSLNAVTYEIAVRKEALLKAQTDLETKSLDLRRKAGLELSRREILMRPSEPFEIGTDEVDVSQAIARSRKWNRKAASIAAQRKISDIDVAVTENATLPQVDVGLSGALIGYGGGGEGEPGEKGIGTAFGALSDGFEVMANLTVSFEIGGGAKAAHEAALAKRHKLDIERADLDRTTDTQVVAAVRAISNAKTRVDLTDQSILVADETLRAERAIFSGGHGDNAKIMRSQTQLIEARLRRGRAVADYHIYVAKLQALNGTLLARYRVDVRPPQTSEGR